MNENKLYVGNLPYTVNQEQLTSLFGQFGDVVEAVVISDRESGRSKGFGFVTMATQEAAQNAISNMHESELEGRKLVVNVARPKVE